MPRALIYTVLACGLMPLHALAVWEYPPAAQLAMFDAVEQRCGSFDPRIFRKEYDKILRGLTAEERSGITKIRQSAEYREVLAEVGKELAGQIAAAGKDGAAKVCKAIIQDL